MDFSAYLGLDVHKDTIAAIADATRASEARFFGEIGNTPDAVAAMLKKLNHRYGRLHCVYESGPCGYDLYRQIIDAGNVCEVVSLAHTLRRAGNHIKNDRRDALMLARLSRAGELTAVGSRTLPTKLCAISSALARLPARTFAKHASAFKASCCVRETPAILGAAMPISVKFRPRQPHDANLACGTQPADEKLLNRRKSRRRPDPRPQLSHTERRAAGSAARTIYAWRLEIGHKKIARRITQDCPDRSIFVGIYKFAMPTGGLRLFPLRNVEVENVRRRYGVRESQPRTFWRDVSD